MSEGGDQPGAFVARLAESIGEHAAASAVFGDAVERNGVTVIPVASAAWGFGGGVRPRGQAAPDQGRTPGGGGGARVRPIGYIVLHGDRAMFRSIGARPASIIMAAGLGLVAGMVAGRLAAMRL